jgi:LysM repeat protein
MGAKFVAGIVGLIIVVVLAQTLFFGGDDDAPSITRPSSIPTATPPADTGEAVLLGEGEAGNTGSQPSGSGSTAAGNTYTVQPGDTLGAIAAQQGVPAEEQAAWIAEVLRLNNMEDARQLQSGQELTLPARSAAVRPTTSPTARAGETATGTPRASSTGTATTPTATARPAGSGGTYTVVSGDYPFLIAEKHCVDDPDAWVDELLELNNADASTLGVGVVLDLPPGTPAFCGGAASDDDDEATPTATPTP